MTLASKAIAVQEDLVEWLNCDAPEAVDRVLRSAALLQPEESIIALAPAGPGNMNVTLRVTIATATAGSQQSVPCRRTVIVKQSRPFVAKYDFIPAPVERVDSEAAFYEFVATRPELQTMMPQCLASIPDQHVLVIQDLGEASSSSSSSPAVVVLGDATSLYAVSMDTTTVPSFLPRLVDWLCALHDASRGGKTKWDKNNINIAKFRNWKLRSLNHDHMFDIPFRDPPVIDLEASCPGLTAASLAVRTNERLRATALRIGQAYMVDYCCPNVDNSNTIGDCCLLHGDFYPGSWYLTTTHDDGHPYVIDPEFCFFGPAEFDWGILVAHLQLMGGGGGNTAACVESLQQRLVARRHDWRHVEEFAAVEVLRRLLGVAQLPQLTLNLKQRMQLIDRAVAGLLCPGSSSSCRR
jgi:5-methylthioribose kinase